MGDRCGMSISVDSPSDETLNRGPLALLLRRQYEFPFGINIVQFSIFNFQLTTPSVREKVPIQVNSKSAARTGQSPESVLAPQAVLKKN